MHYWPDKKEISLTPIKQIAFQIKSRKQSAHKNIISRTSVDCSCYTYGVPSKLEMGTWNARGGGRKGRAQALSRRGHSSASARRYRGRGTRRTTCHITAVQ